MPEAGRHRAYLESPGLDAAGVHEVLDEVLEAKAAAAEGPGQHRELLPRHGERVLDHQIKRGEDAALDQATFAEAFVALTDGIVLTDGKGHVASANPAAFRVLGEDALIGQVFEELLLVSGATKIQD